VPDVSDSGVVVVSVVPVEEPLKFESVAVPVLGTLFFLGHVVESVVPVVPVVPVVVEPLILLSDGAVVVAPVAGAVAVPVVAEPLKDESVVASVAVPVVGPVDVVSVVVVPVVVVSVIVESVADLLRLLSPQAGAAAIDKRAARARVDWYFFKFIIPP
jgi:hypothetical protein